ncbi:hypothetical protein [Haloferula sp. BvORR071]|uniref:hypothetical protein n=1 Tax=Haloferula sp. BvORR071 TaxID=1396141 RepID=UPI000558671F|nr:hypothetical protein [Haloferula sp. BvORR071]
MNDQEPEEWDMPQRAETLPIAPEDHQRLRGFLTELVISSAGTCIFGCFSLIYNPKPLGSWPPPPKALWERVLFEWLPPLTLLLAFACLVWLITIPLRMANLKRSGGSP